MDLDNAVAERLREAFEFAKGSGRFPTKEAFREELGRASVPASHPTVEAYLNGDVEPRPSFMIEFARICGVRAEWLLTGEEPRSPGDEVWEERRREARLGFVGKMEDILTKYFPRHRLHRGELAMVWEAATTYWDWVGRTRNDHVTMDDLHEAAETVARAIKAPLEVLGMGEIPDERMMLFDAMTATAILALFPPEIRGSYGEEPDVPDWE